MPNFIYIMFSMLFSFWAAKYVKGRKGILFSTIVINAGILVFMRFHTYIGMNIVIPLRNIILHFTGHFILSRCV